MVAQWYPLLFTLYPFFGSGFPYKITNPKRGALVIIWLLGYQVLQKDMKRPLCSYANRFDKRFLANQGNSPSTSICFICACGISFQGRTTSLLLRALGQSMLKRYSVAIRLWLRPKEPKPSMSKMTACIGRYPVKCCTRSSAGQELSLASQLHSRGTASHPCHSLSLILSPFLFGEVLDEGPCC